MKTFWTTVLAFGVAALVGAIVYPVFAVAKVSKRSPSISRMKQLGTAAHIYAADFDERLPLAENWGAALTPFAKNPEAFDDPMLAGAKYGFAFYSPVSGVNPNLVEDSGDVPMLMQSDLKVLNAHGDLSALPTVPRISGGRDCYAHLDSSAKIRPREWARKAPVIQLKKGSS